MDGEGAPADANIEQAIYWRQIYRDILTMEENVLARIRELMAKQSTQARRDVELTTAPVVPAPADRFRRRPAYGDARLREPGAAGLAADNGVGAAQMARCGRERQ
mgnify:CR=1 FL=1